MLKMTHMKSINQGTKFLPASSMIFKKAAKIGRPSTAINAQLFSWSMIQSCSVDLLKPCFSSRTKL